MPAGGLSIPYLVLNFRALRWRTYLSFLEGIFTFRSFVLLQAFRFDFSNPVFSTKATCRKYHTFREDMMVHGIIVAWVLGHANNDIRLSTEGERLDGFRFPSPEQYNGFMIPHSHGLILGFFIIILTLF